MKRNVKRQHEIEDLRSFLENATEYIIKNYDHYEKFLENKRLAKEKSEEDKKAYYKDAYKKVTNYLHSLGFSNYLMGFDYLRDEILIYDSHKSFKAIDIDIVKKYGIQYELVKFYIWQAMNISWPKVSCYTKKNILGSRYSDHFSRTEFIKVSHEILNLGRIGITETINDISDIILNNPDKVRKKISKYLTMLNISKELKGYTYLEEAIFIYLSGNSEIVQITKEIYPVIAKKHETTSYAVIRCIRYSIEIVFSKGDIDIVYSLFGNMCNNNNEKVTNYEFIYVIADNVKIELY